MLAGAATAAAAQERRLTVLFTSDVHARVLPFDDVRERPARGSLAQVASLVARVRTENARTVVLDGGDAIQGTPLSHYAFVGAGADGNDPTIAAMNLIGYDAATIGNHEFNYGLDVLRRSLGQSRFPWLAANVGGARDASLPIRGEVVLERGGVAVGVIGLTSPNVPHWDPADHWKGLTFADPVAVAAERIRALRPRVDVLVVVLHAGFERDPATGAADDTEHENFGWRLAQLEGIDLLLTGHTHHDIPPQRLGRTWIAQPGRWAELVTRFDLTLARSGRRWKVTATSGANLKVDGELADSTVIALARAAHERTVAELARPLGELTAPLAVSSLPMGDDAALDLIHAVQLAATGAQLSLAAPLGGRAPFPAGPLTPRHAHALYPYPNTLLVVKVTGSQLRDVLEHAVRGWQSLECGGEAGGGLRREPGLPSYNYDTLEGATYFVDPTARPGARVRGLRFAGRPVAPDEEFTLEINSYRGAGGGRYPHLPSAPRVREIGRPMVELLVEYFAAHPRLTPAATDNWSFTVPLRDAGTGAPAIH